MLDVGRTGAGGALGRAKERRCDKLSSRQRRETMAWREMELLAWAKALTEDKDVNGDSPGGAAARPATGPVRSST